MGEWMYRSTLKLVLKILWEIIGWIYLSQDRDGWQAVVNTEMNFQVP
jgi:hypothetical protein